MTDRETLLFLDKLKKHGIEIYDGYCILEGEDNNYFYLFVDGTIKFRKEVFNDKI